MRWSFVIPAFNSERSIGACLESIAACDDPGVEVCVIDNGSTDSTPDLVLKKYPQMKLIRNATNKGSSFARNQGIRATTGEWVVFLDADACLEADFLEKLKNAVNGLGDRDAGLTVRIAHAGTGRLFSCGLRITSLYRSHDIGKGKPIAGVSALCRIDGFNSCCAVLRRSCLEEVRKQGTYFDEDFFFLFEDTDLSVRLRNKGYRFLFDPRLRCVHAGGSAPIDLSRRRFYAFRNRFYLIAKNEKRPWRFFLRSFFYDIPRSLHFCLTNRHAIEAWRDILRKFQSEKNTRL